MWSTGPRMRMGCRRKSCPGLAQSGAKIGLSAGGQLTSGGTLVDGVSLKDDELDEDHAQLF
jgi:hypothetical protein